MSAKNLILEGLSSQRSKQFLASFSKEIYRAFGQVVSEEKHSDLSNDTIILKSYNSEQWSFTNRKRVTAFDHCSQYFVCLDKKYQLSLLPWGSVYAICLPLKHLYVDQYFISYALQNWLLGGVPKDIRGTGFDTFRNFESFFSGVDAQIALEYEARALNLDSQELVNKMKGLSYADLSNAMDVIKFVENNPYLRSIMARIAKTFKNLPHSEVTFGAGRVPDGVDISKYLTLAVIDMNWESVFIPISNISKFMSKNNKVSLWDLSVAEVASKYKEYFKRVIQAVTI